jgi:hypothetical protein
LNWRMSIGVVSLPPHAVSAMPKSAVFAMTLHGRPFWQEAE